MASNSTVKCLPPMAATSNGVFQGDNPIHFALPLLIIQICLVVVLTRGLAFILKPIRQPRVIAEIIGGILLGPSALGRNQAYLNAIFPKRSITVLDTVANLGLLFFLFLVGLELDLRALRQTGKKALSIAVAGITLPFALGIGTSFVLRATISQGVNQGPLLVFMGVALSITAFPVLARILAELKLLTTDVGQMAISAAAVNDVAAWILLALAISLANSTRSPLIVLWVLFCGCGFLIVCTFVAPPVFKWIEKRCSVGEPVDEVYICLTLAAVLAASFVTDAIGIHALFGAFVIGVLIPKEGAFAGALTEKVEDLVSGLFLPLFFVSSGLKTNIATIQGLQSWGLLVLVILTACLGKIFGTVIVSLFWKLPIREAVTLGFLMNTKGLVELIVLNIGRDRGVLNDQTFAIMVLMALFTTFITTPVVMSVYKPLKRGASSLYKRRSIIGREGKSSEIRLLICFQSRRSVPTLINLMEASRGTTGGGLRVYAMHLMELSERSSAIQMVHKARRNGMPFWRRDCDPNQLVFTFEAFRNLGHVSIRPTTAISSIPTMHEDICGGALRKRVAMIILPFHKHLRIDGRFETTHPEFSHVTRGVLDHAPCSVGVLLDRGLGGVSHIPAKNVDYTVTAFFFGGRDDQEALSYGALMAEHPGISFTVVRFVVNPELNGEITKITVDDQANSGTHQAPRETDEEFLENFVGKASKTPSIRIVDSAVRNSSETAALIREHARCNLVLVGRLPEGEVAAALGGHEIRYPELGPVGNMLISPEYSASVLVVQQFRARGEVADPGQSRVEDETNSD